MPHSLNKIYDLLLNKYGFQGWFPLLSLHSSGVNPTKTGSVNGYHPQDYDHPKTQEEQIEIAIGLILTQNTSWTNVEKALINLQSKIQHFTLESLSTLSDDELKAAIKPAGYFNQKSHYIRAFLAFFESLKGQVPKREELLGVKGVGPETCDAILLYVYKQPEFVIDAYTRRICLSLGLCHEKTTYNELKFLFESQLKPDYQIYNEFHALLVEHAKQYYSKRPYGFNASQDRDFLLC